MSGGAKGGCACGAIRYRVSDDPVAATLCHCRDCRKASGGTHVAWAVFYKNRVEWLVGEPSDFCSSPGIHWLFCRNCGSTLGSRRSARPDHVDITIGTFDEPHRLPPSVEIWVNERIGWNEPPQDLAKR